MASEKCISKTSNNKSIISNQPKTKEMEQFANLRAIARRFRMGILMCVPLLRQRCRLPLEDLPPIEMQIIELPPIEMPPIEVPPMEMPPIEMPPMEMPLVEMPPIEMPLEGAPPLGTLQPEAEEELPGAELQMAVPGADGPNRANEVMPLRISICTLM